MDINVIKLRSSLQIGNKALDKETNNFLEEINNELIDEDIVLKAGIESKINILMCETGGTEGLFFENKDKFSYPLIILSNGKNNSYPASLEIKTYCNSNKLNAIVLTGSEESIAGALKKYIRIMNAKQELFNNNLGVIGKPSDWLIASQIDPVEAKRVFNINIVNIGMDEFFNEINKKKMGNIPNIDEYSAKFKNKEVLTEALYIYGALKRLVDKYNLSGLTVRCFDLLGKYKNTSCLALGILNSEGITAACEGDVPALLTMHFLKALTGRPSFQANPSYINEEEHSMLLAHCTLPLNMCQKYELTTHFESGLGIGIKGDLLLDNITICKFLPNFKGRGNNLVAIPGKIQANKSLKGYCRTQVYVSMEPFDFYELLNADFGNHLIITYGDVIDEFIGLVNQFRYELKKED